MSSSLRRGALAAAVLAFSTAPLAACGVGSDAQTLEVKPDNAATSVGVIKIQNATIITQPKRDAKGPAVVSARLFNNGRTDQTLDGVMLTGTGATAQLKAAKGKGPVTIPAGGSVLLGGKGNAVAVLANGKDAVRPGNVQSVTFSFSKTGDVKLDTFVVPATGYFGAFGPSSLPPTPTQKPSRSPSGGPTASGSPGPSGSPSGQASPSGPPSGAEQGSGGSAQPGDAGVAGAGTPTATATASGT